MKMTEMLSDPGLREAVASRIHGVVVGIVTNNQDPDGLARVKVRFPWLSESDESQWARIAAPMAGAGRGVYFLPEVEDEVLVAFDHGDIRFPFVVGALWNGQDAPPLTNSNGQNDVRVIQSRSGHVVRLNDEDGAETVEIADKTGNNRVLFDTASNTITISSGGDIRLSAPQGTIALEAQNVTVTASADARVEASGNLDLVATGNTSVQGATVNLN